MVAQVRGWAAQVRCGAGCPGAGLAAQERGWLPRCGACCPGAGLVAQVRGWLPMCGAGCPGALDRAAVVRRLIDGRPAGRWPLVDFSETGLSINVASVRRLLGPASGAAVGLPTNRRSVARSDDVGGRPTGRLIGQLIDRFIEGRSATVGVRGCPSSVSLVVILNCPPCVARRQVEQIN